MITVEDEATMRTVMYTHTEVFGNKRTATRTLFACIAWINLQEQSTSIFRFVGCELRKLTPSNISYALLLSLLPKTLVCFAIISVTASFSKTITP